MLPKLVTISLSLLLCSMSFAQSPSKHVRTSADYVLGCRGVTFTSTALKQDGPQAKAQKSSDVFRIARYGRLLKVEVNVGQYHPMDTQSRKLLEVPDPYKIVAETGEGFVAVFVNGSTTLHTLTIDRNLTNGIWTESGFSFLEPQSKPISDTVFFTCTREKS
jgi:hypothetical protein